MRRKTDKILIIVLALIYLFLGALLMRLAVKGAITKLQKEYALIYEDNTNLLLDLEEACGWPNK